MKKPSTPRAFFLISILVVLCMAVKPTDPGIRLKLNKENSSIYEIRIHSLPAEINAAKLDNMLKSKTGILSAETIFSTRICTVEVLHSVTPFHLGKLVEVAGLQVSKTFD